MAAIQGMPPRADHAWEPLQATMLTGDMCGHGFCLYDYGAHSSEDATRAAEATGGDDGE